MVIQDEPHWPFRKTFESQSRAFKEAADEIDRGAGERTGAGASGGSTPGDVKDWATKSGSVISPESFEQHALVSNSTSEHEVRLRDGNRAVKRTWPGFYGQVPTPEQGKLGRRNASPAEYLRRMAVQIDVFGSDLKLEGASLSDKPSMILGQPAGEASLVISQPWFTKCGSVEQRDIDALLSEEGFVHVKDSYFGWYRSDDNAVIVDAKPDNFIKTDEGIIPIDLQMAHFTPDQMREAGLMPRGA